MRHWLVSSTRKAIPVSLTGVRFRANPTTEQKKTLSQWMGCARFVWNAKCEEQEYLYRFAQKYLSSTTRIPVDQTYAQFKNPELSPWLSDCPSIILRNTAYVWRNTFGSFLKGDCGRPRRKKKGGSESIWLTSELFRFECDRLFIGSKTNNVGFLVFKAHRAFQKP